LTDPEGRAVITIRDLTKSYGQTPAVDHLDMEIDSELFVFLGPNGAGKTTTIKLMTGLLTPDQGSIQLNGFDILKDPIQAKRQFGYAPESPNLYEKLTPHEFIEFILAVYKVPFEAGKSRMEQLFDIFELTERADDLIEELSNGMKKKVSLIAALIHQPKILFLDEPTVALDPKAARNLKEILRGLVQKGVCVFMTTHILEVAEVMCDRVGIINRGRLNAVGTLNELRQHYQSNTSLEDIFLHITGEAYSSKIDEFLQQVS
jgi:ABC-2 type transport system ATP-binding protein